jgi:hypothetical protein
MSVHATAVLEGDVGYLPLHGKAEGLCAVIDAEDYQRLSRFSWNRHSSGCAARGVNRNGKIETVYLHRDVLGLSGSPGTQVRFNSSNKLDCRRSNLRPATAWVARQMSNPAHASEITRLVLSAVGASSRVACR